MDLRRAALYWHTIRHLRPVQVLGRARRLLPHAPVDPRPAPPLRALPGPWRDPARRLPSLVGPTRFRLLNEEHDLDAVGWDGPGPARLWRYHQHYFDDLHAVGAAERSDWHLKLVRRWLDEVPPGSGPGWEPYPTSLRIVNWVKWALAGRPPDARLVESLAVQARWLAGRIEWHLLGNHLLANAKALAFAGVFFAGPEADGWLRTAVRILRAQLAEQILDDGGHFERSPMYHSIVLEDVLDLHNLLAACGAGLPADAASFAASLPGIATRMGGWLAAMCHPDGEIAFFNDAACGVAPHPAELSAYAERLGLPAWPPPAGGVVHLRESGYVRVACGPAVMFLDVGPVGPDYLPGHAHADTLSCELSVAGRRLLVNSGTSEYGSGPERQQQRGTAAHNTVTIDGQDSSEVWAGFRVARRAKPFDLSIAETPAGITVACSHDGYARLPGRPIHTRTWSFAADGLSIADRVDGPGRAVAHWHWHPAVAWPGPTRARESQAGRFVIQACVPDILCTLEIEAAACRFEPGSWHPEFGLAVPNRHLLADLADGRGRLRISWRGEP